MLAFVMQDFAALPESIPTELIPTEPISTEIALLAIISVVMLFKWLLQAAIPHQPLTFFSTYCQLLADKVCKSDNSESQQRISGVVALVITFVPLWLILWLFADFVAAELLWQGLLLYLALGNFNLKPRAYAVAKSLVNHKNYVAKQTLASLVLRDTDKLSAMGLSKATIEMLALRHIQDYLAVIALFLLGGGLAAISYRLVLLMHHSWHIKIPKYKDFGRFANAISQVLLWLPCRVFVLSGLLLSLGPNATLIWRLTISDFFKLNSDIAVNFFALTLNLKLGGVAMYKGIKVRRQAFNDNGRQPEPKDIIDAQKFIERIWLLLSVFIGAGYSLYFALR